MQSRTAPLQRPGFRTGCSLCREISFLFPLRLSNPAESGFDFLPPGDLTACRWSFGDPCLPLESPPSTGSPQQRHRLARRARSTQASRVWLGLCRPFPPVESREAGPGGLSLGWSDQSGSPGVQYSRRTEPRLGPTQKLSVSEGAEGCGRGRGSIHAVLSRIPSPVRRRGTRAPAPAGAAGGGTPLPSPACTALTENLSCEALGAHAATQFSLADTHFELQRGRIREGAAPLGHGRGPGSGSGWPPASLARDVIAARQPGRGAGAGPARGATQDSSGEVGWGGTRVQRAR